MASTAFFPKGTTLSRYNGSSYEAIPQLRTCSTPQTTTDEDEITNHDSPGIAKEFIPTLQDQGSINIEFVWNPANSLHQQLFADNQAGTVTSWRITMPNSSTITFNGYVSGLGSPLNHNVGAILSGTLRVASQPSFVW